MKKYSIINPSEINIPKGIKGIIKPIIIKAGPIIIPNSNEKLDSPANPNTKKKNPRSIINHSIICGIIQGLFLYIIFYLIR